MSNAQRSIQREAAKKIAANRQRVEEAREREERELEFIRLLNREPMSEREK